jgi:hypothetical protein
VPSPDPPARRPRPVAATLAWAVAVVGATTIGLTAVGAIGDGIIGSSQRPLNPQEVEARLTAAAAAARPAPAPGGVPTVAPPAAGATTAEALGSRGGTVVARCRTGIVEVVSVIPAQGFRVHDELEQDRGRVRFESEQTRVELRLSCADDRPVAQIRIDD